MNPEILTRAVDTDLMFHQLGVIDTSGGARAVTLPAANQKDNLCGVLNIGTNTVTVTSRGTNNTFSGGGTSYSVAVQYQCVIFISDGAGVWRVLSSTALQALGTGDSPTFAGITLNSDPSTSIQVKRNSAQFDKLDATLANITGLSAPVRAAGIYSFRAVLHVTNTSNLNSLISIGGTATATSIIGQATGVDNGGLLATTGARFTALASAASLSFYFDYITIDGLIVVNAAGTLTVQFAVADVPETGMGSVLANSTFEVKRVA